MDRLFFISIFNVNKQVIKNAITFKPNTVMSWHKKLVKRKWEYSEKKSGRPEITAEIVNLIIQIKQANKRWGYRKIKGELRKLEIMVGKSTIAKILKDAGFPTGKRVFERTWLNFFSSHLKRGFSCDFMVVDTLFLQRLYLFSVMNIADREVVLFQITANPTAIWLKMVIRSGFCTMLHLPDTLISDRDAIYGKWFCEFLKNDFDINLIQTPPRTPNCNAFIERWHRIFREEVLDHCLIFGAKDLKKVTSEFLRYYHYHRPHQGLGFDSPLKKHNAKQTKKLPKIKRSKVVEGLITNFELAA